MATHMRECFSVACLIVLLGVAVPTIVQAQHGSDFDGTYMFAGGEAERAAAYRAG